MNDNTEGKQSILLVDDDVDLVELIELALKHAGYETLSAANGQEAIEVLQNQCVDLIILDIMMPVMDGIRFLHWLRQERSDDTPVLVYSAVVHDDIEEEALRVGATILMTKPRKLAELLKQIKLILGE